MMGSGGGASSRRGLYREAKRKLLRLATSRWKGARSQLESLVRLALRRRSFDYLKRVVREYGFAASLAAALLVGASASAGPQINLADIANGDGGYVIDARVKFGFAHTASALGDVNGDGIADFGIIEHRAKGGGGDVIVVFGKSDTSPLLVEDIRNGVGGFVVAGTAGGIKPGAAVAGAGDVNGDGLSDIITGTGYDGHGTAHVVFGKATTTPVDLTTLNQGGPEGFEIVASTDTARLGASVAGLGDVNGDGLSDVLVGAPGSTVGGTINGAAFVVFGKASTTAVSTDDINNGTAGFVIQGAAAFDNLGRACAAAGDMNQDGLDDILVSAPSAARNGMYGVGEAYVVYGKSDTTPVSAASVAAGSGGFAMLGVREHGQAGYAVSGAGDLNGDGIVDIALTYPYAHPNGVYYTGEVYIVFGKTDTSAVSLSDVEAGIGGRYLIGETTYDYTGFGVADAGDVNGDGLHDLALGAMGLSSGMGGGYVMFGSATATPSFADISAGTGGFRLNGESSGSRTGSAIAGIGDQNGDGLGDLLITAPFHILPYAARGRAYVVFSQEEAPVLDTDEDGLTDAQEIDLAMGSGCPDPTNPDSDGDGLTDGEEVLGLGTNPCAADTDGDGVNDAVDPTPTTPGVTGDYLEEFIRDVADVVSAFDLALVDSPNANAAAGRRNAMASKVREAANLAAAGDIAGAIAELQSLLLKLDGANNPPDWMVASDEKAQLNSEIALMISLLQLLAP